MLTPTEAEEHRSSAKPLTRGTPLDHSCGRVAQRALERRRVQQRCPRGFSSAALGRRPQNRAKGADPRTGTPKEAKRVSALVPGPPVPGLSWFRFAGSPALPLRVPVCFCSASCFFSLAAGVTFQLPAGGTSGQAQNRHRPKNRNWAPTQGPAFSGTPLRSTFTISQLCTRRYGSGLVSGTWSYSRRQTISLSSVSVTCSRSTGLLGISGFLSLLLRCTIVAAHGGDRTTSGCYYSHTVPIYEGFILYHAILRLAGRDLSRFLVTNLIERWYSFTARAEKEIVPVVKEKPCYVCLDFGTEHKSLKQADKENVYVLPEGSIITVATNVSVSRNCCSQHSPHGRLDVDFQRLAPRIILTGSWIVWLGFSPALWFRTLKDCRSQIDCGHGSPSAQTDTSLLLAPNASVARKYGSFQPQRRMLFVMSQRNVCCFAFFHDRIF